MRQCEARARVAGVLMPGAAKGKRMLIRKRVEIAVAMGTAADKSHTSGGREGVSTRCVRDTVNGRRVNYLGLGNRGVQQSGKTRGPAAGGKRRGET